MQRLENSNIPKIDAVLRVGYDSLHENEQTLFLLIAIFFNYQDDGHVKTMLADTNLDVRLGLKTLAYKSLTKISSQGKIVMHKLLQQVGRQAVQRQEPWKRRILIDPQEICDVLEPWKRQVLTDTDEIRDVLENDSVRSFSSICYTGSFSKGL
ncbi:hypothetical protein EYS10_02455 (plasmid) [Rahnella aquatilis]|nr:hypothetical protein EYS10_02455 [Rahnella aquatilis]